MLPILFLEDYRVFSSKTPSCIAVVISTPGHFKSMMSHLVGVLTDGEIFFKEIVKEF